MASTINPNCRVREIRNIDRIEHQQIYKMLTSRLDARKEKNFSEADRIRDELLAKGIVLKDGPDGTTWEVKR